MDYRLQHAIPRFALDHFKDAKGLVWTYDKQNRKYRPATPEKTGVIAHFYSIENDHGTMDARLERALGQFEAEAATPYRKLANGEMISGADRAFFARFLGMMVVRTTSYRRVHAKIYSLMIGLHFAVAGAHDRAFDTLVKKLEERDGKKLDPEYLEKLRADMMNLTAYELNVPKEVVLAGLSHGERYAHLFVQMHWSLLRAESGYFITSDNPVHRAVHPSTVHPFYGDHGFLNKTAQVTFPLSPKMLLMMTWTPAHPRVHPVERQFVEGQNTNRAATAEGYLYAHLEDQRIVRLAAKYKDSRPDIKGGSFAGSKGFGAVKVQRRRPKAV